MQPSDPSWKTVESRAAFGAAAGRQGEIRFVYPGSDPDPFRETSRETLAWAPGRFTRDGKENPAEESTITTGSDRQVVEAPSAV